MTAAAQVRGGALARILFDAERAASEGAKDRSRALFSLAGALATGRRVPGVLLSWNSAALDAPPPTRPAAVRAAGVGLPMPDFPAAPPRMASVSPLPALPVSEVVPRMFLLPEAPVAQDGSGPKADPRRSKRSGGGKLAKNAFILALAAGAILINLPPDAREKLSGISAQVPGVSVSFASLGSAERALESGDAAGALSRLDALEGGVRGSARAQLARGKALTALGRSAEAGEALVAAARADTEGRVGWMAARAAAGIAGQEAAAAEAYLLAFAHGGEQARSGWKEAADAQRRAGEAERAVRIERLAASSSATGAPED